mmetsp:Transcript_16828/g.29339  ORF Transcript_16828/g.29339 Transcript_16828/m.29339 type:complete len:247 (-) Transcript_16828:416-1156(-)
MLSFAGQAPQFAAEGCRHLRGHPLFGVPEDVVMRHQKGHFGDLLREALVSEGVALRKVQLHDLVIHNAVPFEVLLHQPQQFALNHFCRRSEVDQTSATHDGGERDLPESVEERPPMLVGDSQCRITARDAALADQKRFEFALKIRQEAQSAVPLIHWRCFVLNEVMIQGHRNQKDLRGRLPFELFGSRLSHDVHMLVRVHGHLHGVALRVIRLLHGLHGLPDLVQDGEAQTLKQLSEVGHELFVLQ